MQFRSPPPLPNLKIPNALLKHLAPIRHLAPIGSFRVCGDASVLDAELKKKLVGTEATRKGVRQLADAIEKLFGRNVCDQVSDIFPANIENVIPLLLTRDDIGSAY